MKNFTVTNINLKWKVCWLWGISGGSPMLQHMTSLQNTEHVCSALCMVSLHAALTNTVSAQIWDYCLFWIVVLLHSMQSFLLL